MEERKNVFDELEEKLSSFPCLHILEDAIPTCFKFPIKMDCSMNSDEAVRFLRRDRVEAATIYKPLHFFENYMKYQTVELRQAEKLFQSVFLIPNPSGRGKASRDKLIETLSLLSKHITRKHCI